MCGGGGGGGGGGNETSQMGASSPLTQSRKWYKRFEEQRRFEEQCLTEHEPYFNFNGRLINSWLSRMISLGLPGISHNSKAAGRLLCDLPINAKCHRLHSLAAYFTWIDINFWPHWWYMVEPRAPAYMYVLCLRLGLYHEANTPWMLLVKPMKQIYERFSVHAK